MAEPLDELAKVMEVGPGLLRQMSKQLESLQETVSLNPPDHEVTEVLGKEATAAEREAYRQGHQSGWYKGALMFGCAILAGLAVLTLAVSGRSKESAALMHKE
jgi:hypothetical protein